MNKCIAPNCDYNYDSEGKKRKLWTEFEKISIFAFPKHKEKSRKKGEMDSEGTSGKLTPKE